MMSKRWKQLCGVVLALSLAACPGPTDSGTGGGSSGTGGSIGTGGSGGSGGTGSWTVLVYLVADNDLEPFAMGDLKEMAAVGSSSGLSIVVQADRAAGYSSDGVLNVPDWTSTKRFLVGSNSLTELADLGEVNMAEASTLSDFIKWGLQTYPAAQTALVLWDHGGGSLMGFGVDEQSSSAIMGLPAIQTAVSTGLSQAGRAKFDIIGFDACLMASFEVAEALKAHASYLIASEESEPGHGWDYRALAGVGASTSPTALGQKIADGFKAQAQDPAWHDDASITLSVIDLSKLGPLEAALATLATTYPNGTALAPVVNTLGQGQNTALKFGDNPDPAKAFNLVDLSDLFAKASTVAGAATIQSAVSGAVVYQVTGSATARARGLSIYFPPGSTYYNAKYDAVAALPGVAGVPQWRTFLQAYFGGGGSGGAPSISAGTVDITSESFTLAGTLSNASSLADAFMVYGIKIDNGVGEKIPILLGENQAVVSDSKVSASWDWSVLSLQQGSYFEYGYLAVRSLSATQAIASIPLVYEYGGKSSEAIRAIVYNASDGSQVSDRTYVYSSSGALGELSAQPGSKLHAKVAYLPDYTQYTPQWVLFNDAPGAGFDATQAITIGFAAVIQGAEVYGALRVENAAHDGHFLYTLPGQFRP